MADAAPLIVIVGPTASGKSATAVELAMRIGGEIICADARTIYKGMDIGTAKPTSQERLAIPHHVLDIIEPSETYNAAQFKELALTVIDKISARGKVPIMVGGTGLYVDAVLFDFTFRPPADSSLRAELMNLSIGVLQDRLREKKIPLPVNERNPRHLIRAIETGGLMANRSRLRANTAVYGLACERPELAMRINRRVEQMIASGLEREVSDLVGLYGWNAPGMQTIGYQEWREYYSGDRSLEKTTELIQLDTRKYAKRQQTWFKRNSNIQWMTEPNNIVNAALTFLNKTA